MNNNRYKKILIIRTGAIGDVVHTSNLFRSIKKAYPDVIVHYLTSETIKPLLVENPDIEKVITINPGFRAFSSYTKEFAAELKKENYDLVINLQPSFKIKFLIFLAGIKNKVAYKKDFKLHAVKNFWLTGLKAFPLIKEESDLKLYLPDNSVERAKELLKDLPRPFIVINAGGVFSKRKGRTYPIDKWAILTEKLLEKYRGTIILNGSKEDEKFLSPLATNKNVLNLIGKLSLIDSCAVISQADYMISGDSGPLHIATALGVKSIGLFGSMPVNRTGCYCNGINIVADKDCVPCNRRKCRYIKNKKDIYAPCMVQIEVSKIIENICL